MCLGLKHKKDLVKNLMQEHDIDILCMQETEIECGYDAENLKINGYSLELEKNSIKSRTGMYIKNCVKYIRRVELEGIDVHMVIIELPDCNSNKLINIYRSFNPVMRSASDSFKEQLDLIKRAWTKGSILLGDFNLDYKKLFDIQYAHAGRFNDMEDILLNYVKLVQVVNFETWTRIVGNSLKCSTLDHIYVEDPTRIKLLDKFKPYFGDHNLVMFTMKSTKDQNETRYVRNWKVYSKEKLCYELSRVEWNINAETVQDVWNLFEEKIIKVVDKVAPMIKCTEQMSFDMKCPVIRSKINCRNRLLCNFKRNPSTELKSRIKSLNSEIRIHFFSKRKLKIKRSVIPGNCKSLWNAVNAAKDIGKSSLPSCMKFKRKIVGKLERAECFAEFFSKKVEEIVTNINVDQGVYNGERKIQSNDSNFMTHYHVTNAIKDVKIKNTEGYDRIPQRILIEGADFLIGPLTLLFKIVYRDKCIPEQWRFAKIIPVHKKDSKQEIENYRPVANLCSVSKIFERMILNRIIELESLNGVDLTGKEQHGFKKGKGTATAGLLLQSLVSRALDNDNYVAMASIDLSAAFDVVDIGLLIKRLKIVGLPSDLVSLIDMAQGEIFLCECWQ